MKIYAVEERLANSILECTSKVRVQVAIDFTGTGVYVAVPECDIKELTITSLKEVTGGTISFGTLVLENDTGA